MSTPRFGIGVIFSRKSDCGSTGVLLHRLLASYHRELVHLLVLRSEVLRSRLINTPSSTANEGPAEWLKLIRRPMSPL
jgi:hypothetical protein